MPPPVIRTPISDLLPAGYSHQTFGRCMKFEDRYLQCSEAYGLRLSQEKCADFRDDLYECNSWEKQLKRIKLMKAERQKKIKSGELPPGKEYQPTPELNAYGGTFFGTHY